MPSKLTTEEFIKRARSVHGDRYSYENAVYASTKTPVLVTCSRHGDFAIRPHNLFGGKGCPKCAGRGLTDAEHIERFREVHGDKYDYSKFGPYKTAKTKYTFICPAHGEFQQTADKHLQGGCVLCAIDFRAAKRVSRARQRIIDEFRATHGDKYDYSKVDYKTAKQKVTITCAKHGDFKQIPDAHKRGNGCPRCGDATTAERLRKTHNEFLIAALTTHGDLYDYSKARYVDSETKVTIICPAHGEFEQRAIDHARGQGCPRCVGKGVTTEIFIDQCRAVHGDKYDYSKTIYTGVFDPVVIECPEHGEFEQSAKNHRDGSECPICGMEKAVRNRVASIAALFEERARAVHGGKYDYSNAVYELSDENVTIVCPDHGEFEQTPSKHLQGQGCPACASTGYDQTKSGMLYYLRISDRVFGALYKIGITNRSVSERFQSRDLDKITVIKSWMFEFGIAALSFETLIKQHFREHRHFGEEILSSGNSEVFTKDVLGLDPESREPRHPIVDEILVEAMEILVGDFS